MIFIGLDPGLTGAIATVDSNAQLLQLADLPVIRDGKLAWIDSNELTSLFLEVLQGRPASLHVERASARPGQGVSSTFCTGVVMGSILAACQQIHAPLNLVTAAKWKPAMGLSADKAASLDKARLLFPGASLVRKKDHNRAEAILLAEYGRRAFVGKVAA